LVDWIQHEENDQLDIRFTSWTDLYSPVIETKVTDHRFDSPPSLTVARVRSRQNGMLFLSALVVDSNTGELVHAVSIWDPMQPIASGVNEKPPHEEIKRIQTTVRAKAGYSLRQESESAESDHIYNPAVEMIDEYTALVYGTDADENGYTGAVLISQDAEGNLTRESVPIQVLLYPQRTWLTGLHKVENLQLTHTNGEELANTKSDRIFASLVCFHHTNTFGIELYVYSSELKSLSQIASIELDDTAVCSIGRNNMPTIDKIEMTVTDAAGSGGTYYAIVSRPVNMTYAFAYSNVAVPADSIRRRSITQTKVWLPLLSK
jgi:hypothetical protein